MSSQTTKEKCQHFKQAIENLKTKFRKLYTVSNTDLKPEDTEFKNCVNTHDKYYELSTFIDEVLPKLKQEIIDNLKFSHEQYLTELHPFMMETYGKWGHDPEQLETAQANAENPNKVHITDEIPFDELREENLVGSARNLLELAVELKKKTNIFNLLMRFIPPLTTITGKRWRKKIWSISLLKPRNK
jgi:hypothetical protein